MESLNEPSKINIPIEDNWIKITKSVIESEK